MKGTLIATRLYKSRKASRPCIHCQQPTQLQTDMEIVDWEDNGTYQIEKTLKNMPRQPICQDCWDKMEMDGRAIND